ncbi:MAG: DUF4252 domain-containing protein [Bacteroidia bacterium]
MKSIIIAIAALVFSVGVFAQNIIDNQFSNYEASENFGNVHVSSKMFQLAAYIENEDQSEDLEELKEFAATINEFNMLLGHELKNLDSEFKIAKAKAAKGYEELMSVDEEEGSFVFYIREANGLVSEMVMIGSVENTLIIASVTGAMELSKLGKFSKKLGGNGFENMGKLFDNGVQDMRVFPNPSKTNSTITVEVPDEMQQGKVTLRDMNGRELKTNEMNGKTIQLTTEGLKPGTYIIEIKNDKASIKQKVVLQ